MSDQSCGNCIYFQPARNENTGRVCPSRPGECTWRPPDIVFPESYTGDGTYWRPDESPIRKYPHYDMLATHGAKCKCWKQNPAKVAKQKPQVQIGSLIGDCGIVKPGNTNTESED